MMTYATAIQRLSSLAGELQLAPGQAPREFNLSEMRVLADGLRNPQKRFPSILIAGTNGKGSTAATLASVLQASGCHVGLQTSPHLAHVNERIRINGEDISDVDFAQYYFEVESIAQKLVEEGRLAGFPSFFEMVTAIGFVAFAEAKIEVAVLEVSMGGRVDATNIVDPSASVFADISLDHTEWLGTTVAAIAREKAGILRNQGVMVTLPQSPEVNQSLAEVATPLRVRMVNAAEYVPTGTRSPHRLRNQYPIRVQGERIEVDSPLRGKHQQRNLALAIATAIELRSNHGYNITQAAITTGIRDTRWPGRLEQFKASSGAAIVLDVGHNPACAWAVRSFLVRMEKRQPRTLIFSCLRDKAISEIAEILSPLFDHVIITQVNSPRAATLEELTIAFVAAGSVTVETQPDAHAALTRAQELTPNEGIIVGIGSFYLIGGLRAELTSEHSISNAKLQVLSQ
jgi:dihydrofolate synthase/folylpolyglutamate synthase